MMDRLVTLVIALVIGGAILRDLLFGREDAHDA